MKKSIFVIMLSLSVGNVIAQVKNLDISRVNIKKNIIKSPEIKVSAKNLPNKLIDLSKIPKLNATINAVRLSDKYNKITPINPYKPNLYLSYFGNYNKDKFVFIPIPPPRVSLRNISVLTLSDEEYSYRYLYSGKIHFNTVRGKEYKCSIVFDKITEGGSVIVRIGETDYSISVNQQTKSVSFNFFSKLAGNQIIYVSPLVVDKRRPYVLKSLSIKSIIISMI